MGNKELIGKGQSHSKVILMGEHAVVYGEPAIAIPFKRLQIEAITTPKSGPITINSMYHEGYLSDAPKNLENVVSVINNTLEYLGEAKNGFHIEINSTIPPERGLGSSAAVSGAVVRSLFDYFDQELTQETLLELMDIGERIAHGNPSGLDAYTTSSEDSVLFRKGEKIENMPISLDAYLIVGDTGDIGNTKLAVSNVRNILEKFPEKSKSAVKKLGEFSISAKDAILERDPSLLGEYMNKAHSYLQELAVSNASLDQLVEAALDAGALGAKLTGGGQGGCMIALAKDKENVEDIIAALIDAGAKDTWVYSLSSGESDV